MSTETELRRASESLAKIICEKIDALDVGTFEAKEIKELTAIVKDLSAIDKSLGEGAEAAEIKVIFEGGDERWAK